MKTFGLMYKLQHGGRLNLSWMFRVTAMAHNFARLKAFA